MSSLYEIVELANGDIALKRVDDEEGSEPLLHISFSDESAFFLGDARLDVAKAMIEAGLDVVSEMVEPEALTDAEVGEGSMLVH